MLEENENKCQIQAHIEDETRQFPDALNMFLTSVTSPLLSAAITNSRHQECHNRNQAKPTTSADLTGLRRTLKTP